jgi:hypothetical protein
MDMMDMVLAATVTVQMDMRRALVATELVPVDME